MFDVNDPMLPSKITSSATGTGNMCNSRVYDFAAAVLLSALLTACASAPETGRSQLLLISPSEEAPVVMPRRAPAVHCDTVPLVAMSVTEIPICLPSLATPEAMSAQ